jgi:hypothetical protein
MSKAAEFALKNRPNYLKELDFDSFFPCFVPHFGQKTRVSERFRCGNLSMCT